MALATDLHTLVEELASQLDSLNLSSDDQEEYSTMLSRLENQADADEPNERIVSDCIAYFSRVESRQSGL
jgi:hypothetical protein